MPPPPPKRHRTTTVSSSSSSSSSSPSPDFDDYQRLVLDAVVDGKNVFMTGPAGSGKSFCIQEIKRLGGKSTFVTAMTGQAAGNVDGTTLHSFAGIGLGDGDVEQVLANVRKYKSNVARWRKCKTLVIDEVSMLNEELLTKLDYVAREVRGRKDERFGGVQVVFCGDPMQLRPVKGTPWHESELASRLIDVTVQLKLNHRQTGDDLLRRGLAEMRLGRLLPEFIAALKKHPPPEREDGLRATMLVSTNVEADVINERELSRLPGASKRFFAKDSSTEERFYKNLVVQRELELKVGAQVVVLKNMPEYGLFNGSRGVVTGFSEDDENPTVRFLDGQIVEFRPHAFEVRDNGKTVATRIQHPLRVAYAMTIHKAQGMTIDFLHVHLSRVFAAGQAYVAMSRAKSMENLYVTGLTESAVFCDPKALSFVCSL